jgi:light-regulated signal transduction histidine kinase (bacteriophytochrome)
MADRFKQKTSQELQSENARLHRQLARLEGTIEQITRPQTSPWEKELLPEAYDHTTYDEMQIRIAELTRINEDLQQELTLCRQSEAEMQMLGYAIVHSLRTPLGILKTCTESLQADCPRELTRAACADVDRMQRSIQRMDHIIDDLLHLAQITDRRMQLEPVNLSNLAYDIIALWHDLPGHDVEVILTDNMVVVGDPQLLRIALENLLNNAWKFTRNQPHALIEFGMTHCADHTVYVVADNGIGFDPSQSDQLFCPFQRLHSAQDFPGTGIGLTLVQRSIQRHGGQVWAEGFPDQGATFYFTLAQPTPSGDS